jgi:hypothetical protein
MLVVVDSILVLMTDLRNKIRDKLLEKLNSAKSKQGEPLRFESDQELEQAVDIILKRFEQISILGSKIGGSTQEADSYLRERSAKGKMRNFPQNNVPFASLVSQTTSLGLCPLPNRVDCLTALITRYPEIQPEGDLSLSEVFSEPLSVRWNEPPSNPEATCKVKRLKIKYH